MNILIHWSSKLELGLKDIDQHHKKLVDLINQAYDLYIIDMPNHTIQEVISELIDYAFVHFKFEEKHFAKFGYENTGDHIKEHNFFNDKIKQLQRDWDDGSKEKKEEVVEFLKKWLEYHILTSDKKYVDCFVRNGM